MKRSTHQLVPIVMTVLLTASCSPRTPDSVGEGVGEMSFFVTSVSPGSAGNLGGLAGADAHCQTLADAAGSQKKGAWRAYLSASAGSGTPSVNARDRIGSGPWFNAKGVQVAANVADLHGAGNNLGSNPSVHLSGHTLQLAELAETGTK